MGARMMHLIIAGKDLEIYSVEEIAGYIKSVSEQAIRICLSLEMQER